jgi:hypothetical protein
MTSDQAKTVSEPAKTGILCKKYVAISGQKRCMYYTGNGACSRKDELMCSEWVRKNPNLAAIQIQRDDTAGPPQPTGEPVVEQAATTAPAQAVVRPRTGGMGVYDACGAVPVPSAGPKPPESPADFKNRLGPDWVSPDEVANLAKSGKEINFEVSGLGSIWLVPSYTDSPRQELTYGDARFVLAVKEVFGKAQIVEITKPAHVGVRS